MCAAPEMDPRLDELGPAGWRVQRLPVGHRPVLVKEHGQLYSTTTVQLTRQLKQQLKGAEEVIKLAKLKPILFGKNYYNLIYLLLQIYKYIFAEVISPNNVDTKIYSEKSRLKAESASLLLVIV